MVIPPADAEGDLKEQAPGRRSVAVCSFGYRLGACQRQAIRAEARRLMLIERGDKHQIKNTRPCAAAHAELLRAASV